MPLIISLLEILGLNVTRAGVTGYMATVLNRIAVMWSRSSILKRKLIKWVGSALALGAEYIDDLEDGYNWLKQGVIEYLERITGQVISDLDKESIKNAAGRMAADEIAKQLQKRYGLVFPIENVASDTLVEELGEWFADLVNQAVSNRIGYQVEIFTTLFPYDNVAAELDTFITDAINERLGINIDSVFNLDGLQSQIKNAIYDQLANALNEALITAKQQAMQQVNVSLNLGFNSNQLKDINDAYAGALFMLSLDINNIMPNSNNKFFFKSTKRLNNKLRQRAYRKTHRQQTEWVIK